MQAIDNYGGRLLDYYNSLKTLPCELRSSRLPYLKRDARTMRRPDMDNTPCITSTTGRNQFNGQSKVTLKCEELHIGQPLLRMEGMDIFKINDDDDNDVHKLTT